MERTEAREKVREADDPLEILVAEPGSLKKAIEQIKTSVLYPNTSLPVFLHGDTGAGKSTWPGRFMSCLSSGTYGRGAVHHAELCPVRQQCGVVVQQSVRICKRSVCGAYGSVKGLLEAADGGMLFGCEVRRLRNNESQEKLFIFLDQGIFRRMGESEGWHKAKVRIVMAPTESRFQFSGHISAQGAYCGGNP